MPNYVTITADELEVGQQITAWWLRLPSAGQGGKVTRIAESFFELVAGTPPTTHTITFAEVHHFTVERFLDADECVSSHEGDCCGVVDYCYAPSGSNIPRCVFHNDERWREYEANKATSVAHFADSDVRPDWFHEADAGEHWAPEDY